MSLDNWIFFWQWLLWNSQRCSKQFIFRGLHNWIMQMLQWKEDVKIDISCCMPFYVPFCKLFERALNVTHNAVDIDYVREEKFRTCLQLLRHFSCFLAYSFVHSDLRFVWKPYACVTKCLTCTIKPYIVYKRSVFFK